jgi:hypothetical protein
VDSAGDLYIQDARNGRVRKIDQNGIITTFAGNGTSGTSGDGGPTVDANGIVTTVVGNGSVGYCGDGGPAIQACTPGPKEMACDALPAGHGDEGNQFASTGSQWQYNLKTMNYSAEGTCTITMASGDDTEYLISLTCEAEFVIG